MAHFGSILATSLVLLMFAVFGVAASVYSGRAFIAAWRSGVIRQSGRSLSFQQAPARFIGGMVHIALGFVAAVICIALVVVLIIRAV